MAIGSSRDALITNWSWPGYLVAIILFLDVQSLEGVFHPADKSSDSSKGKICSGTNERFSVPSNRKHHYWNLRERYTNCTYVDGNLELTWIEDENLDLSFLQNIREVTGYVLVSHVYVRRVVLPKLQIIRGRTLLKLRIHEQEFALVISLCKMHAIEMPSLRDIFVGGVGVFNNYNLCHIRSINWKEIITGPGYYDVFVYNFTSPEKKCQPCDNSCEKGCWGEGPENCQKFSKLNCSPQCSEGRCFGPNPRECCHLSCAGGCTGPKPTDCLACRNFYDDGECTQKCPSTLIYNPSTYSWENNPRGKYAYGATCVKNCPEHLLRENGACVRSCSQNKTPLNGECVSCEGECPKTCKGVEADRGVHAGNINEFKGCTIIDGSISILDHSFSGYQHVYFNYSLGPLYPAMHPDRLEVFSTLKEVTGFINIQGSHRDFRNLSYFRNVQIIGGRSLIENFALYIVKTSITSLGLQSLKKISGGIGIFENKELCFVNGINWTNIRKTDFHGAFILHNRNESECGAEGLVCDLQCSSEGCWGPGPKQCISCANFKSGNECVQNCNSVKGMYTAGPNLCKPCHEECASTCIGPGNGNCTKCKNVRDGPLCYASCPETKYNDSGECKPCHRNCVNGCTGPANTIGPNGCVSCNKAIINSDLTVERCLLKDEPCPVGYYDEWVGPQFQGPFKPLAGKATCRKCHSTCKKCTGYGTHEEVCQECTYYKRGTHCEEECPQDYYPDESTQKCFPCSMECRGCYGPDASHCHKCRNFRLYLDENGHINNDTAFNCTTACPPETPRKIYPQRGNGEPYCSAHTQGAISKFVDNAQWIVFITLIVIFLVVVLVFYQCRKKVKTKEEEMKMTRVWIEKEDSQPLRPSNVKPNLAKLRIIKEGEMHQGGILGYGAFGTVYKGIWVPKSENVKIPVAIKVLREGTSPNTSKEFLEEAYIMATVEHPNLLQLLAVCMTSKIMLITQLMPLGCLLEYVRTNNDKIGSKLLLTWCAQIARGMAYLEEKRLVHRDLAARNVLVQTPNCVKITDFGLAKLLDVNQEAYKAERGKMPIKWLALECIQHRIYTHKSDVWAFGVTIWELLTYGGRPYENVPARDVPELLEKGERLSQPPICTIEVYKIMVKCWILDADNRPSFKELADDFTKMSLDSCRYLVIQGDKLLKLPSCTTQQQEKDLIHRPKTGTIEGPENVTEGDDRQTPVVVRDHQFSTSSLTPILKQSFDSPIPQTQHNWYWELRYAHGHYAKGNGVTSRCCRDHLKMGKNVDVTNEWYDAKPAIVGDIKFNLPLEEDDYLVASPQQTEFIATHMNVDREKKTSDETNCRNTGFPQFHLPVDPIKPNTSVENPEYIMNKDLREGDMGPVVVDLADNLVAVNLSNLADNLAAVSPSTVNVLEN